MIDLADITLAVLAGGESTRMGEPKAALRVCGQPILKYMIDRFAWPGPTLLVTAPGREHPPGAEHFDGEAVDPVAGQGPLRGFLTALEHSQTPLTIITAVDMPLIGFRQLQFIAEQLDARREAPGVALLRSSSSAANEAMPDPLPCGLRASTIDVVRAALESDRPSLQRLLKIASFRIVPAPNDVPETWTNLNYRSDFEAFRTFLLDRQ